MPLPYDKKALTKLSREYSLRFVILHGSQATLQTRDDSDIDIAVLPKSQLKPEQFLRLSNDLARVFQSERIDCKSIFRTDSLFRYQVVKTGLLLYGKEIDYEDFKAFAHRSYHDARSLRQLEKVLIKKSQTALDHHYA